MFIPHLRISVRRGVELEIIIDIGVVLRESDLERSIDVAAEIRREWYQGKIQVDQQIEPLIEQRTDLILPGKEEIVQMVVFDGGDIGTVDGIGETPVPFTDNEGQLIPLELVLQQDDGLSDHGTLVRILGNDHHGRLRIGERIGERHRLRFPMTGKEAGEGDPEFSALLFEHWVQNR